MEKWKEGTKMDKLRVILRMIVGIWAVFMSVLFMAVTFDLIPLILVGMVVSPILVIFLNKKKKLNTIKWYRYYGSLVGVLAVTILAASCSMADEIDTNPSKNKVAVESEEKDKESKPEDKKDDIKESEDDSKVEEVKKDETKDTGKKKTPVKTEKVRFPGYKLITVDGGDLSGHREPNAVVDIGYGDREYWAFTNEYGQLVKVIAKKIVIQDDSKEPVTSSGRYYKDEAKVPGTERADLDEGHVIADSLGGVSNAYNITPQDSTLNRHGDQAYMEKVIRDAGGCTDFVAIITYPNTKTQIPSHYKFTYILKGNKIVDSFDNANPEASNKVEKPSKPAKKPSKPVKKPSEPVKKPSEPVKKPSEPVKKPSKPVEKPSKPATETVYWTPNGKSYHTTRNCPTLSRSKTILEGTIAESGKSDPCDRCH